LRKRRRWPWWVAVWSERVKVGSIVGGVGDGAGERGLGLERVLAVVVVVVSIFREIWVSGAS
jgi:hypothetical protein